MTPPRWSNVRRSLRRPRTVALTALATIALVGASIGPAQAASLFSDGFESGTMSAWTTVTAAAGGVVGVQSTTVHSGTKAAQLSESGTSGSLAYARTQLSGDQTDLTATGAFMVTTEGLANANVPIFRFLDATGARAISLYRQNQSGNHLWVKVGNGSAAVRRPACCRSRPGACCRCTRSSPAPRAPSRSRSTARPSIRPRRPR